MTIFHLLLIIGGLGTIIFLILYTKNDDDLNMLFAVLFVLIFVGGLLVSIIQPIKLKNEAVRQEKEREQIVYQIESLTDEKDKIKLNEWILTYNDWVNDINTNKEIWGWFAWYRDFDMSNHQIINLV